MLKKFIAVFLSIFLCQVAYAGGVSLGATRIIYPISANQVTLKVYNSDEKRNYLVQSWVTNSVDKKTNDFIITPPLFVIKADTNNVLRVVFTGNKDNLPKDRESLFYLYSKVIPSTADLNSNQSALLISTTSKIKLFMRPSNLTVEEAMESYKKLKCSYQNNQIKIENPTPFYMNLVTLRVNNKEVSNAVMIPPMDSAQVKTTEKGNALIFNMISDYGAQIKDNSCAL
ncbi:fimbria/pilus periplasmic chaperone [Orbus wheelerorum]|uniref:fimbrial biogenesis chaperone n=1 Tax=Orbus wheelerorum TaxID=3074111 RepID=UPI00370DA8E5